MITTGIIRQINISSAGYDYNKYIVEINYFQIPGDENKSHYTFEANCCLPGGLYQAYEVGDMVYIGFVNNELSFPVILGRIYKGLDDNYRAYAQIGDLAVQNSVDLPAKTTIGEVSYTQLQNALSQINKHDIQIEQLIKTTTKNSCNMYSVGQISDDIAKQLKIDISNKKSISINGLIYDYLKENTDEAIYRVIDYNVTEDKITCLFAIISIVNDLPNFIELKNKEIRTV